MVHLDISLDCELFAFSFRVGSKPSEDPPKSIATADIDTGNPSNESIQGGENARSRGFLEIPTEILDAVFQELLERPETIEKAHGSLGTEQVLASRCKRIKGLEPAILCTCRSIYLQALPILYGNNTFKFNSGESLTEFAHKGLDGRFAFQNAHYGRLTMVRYATIELRYGNQHGSNYLDTLWRHWNKVLKPDDHRDIVGFPSLLGIALDFSTWETSFGVEEINHNVLALILSRVNPLGALKTLDVIGLRNQRNLHYLRRGLVQPEGRLRVLRWQDKCLVDMTNEYVGDLKKTTMEVR